MRAARNSEIEAHKKTALFLGLTPRVLRDVPTSVFFFSTDFIYSRSGFRQIGETAWSLAIFGLQLNLYRHIPTEDATLLIRFTFRYARVAPRKRVWHRKLVFLLLKQAFEHGGTLP